MSYVLHLLNIWLNILCLFFCVQDAFSLLAYSDPWNCPVGQQLDPTQRESLCSALNSAILGKDNTFTDKEEK